MKTAERPDKKDYPDGTIQTSALETWVVPNASYVERLEDYADSLQHVTEQQSKEIERLKERKISYQKGDNESLDELIERRSEALFSNPYTYNSVFDRAYRDAAKCLDVDNLLDKVNDKDQLLKEMAETIEELKEQHFQGKCNVTARLQDKFQQTLSKYKETETINHKLQTS